MIVLETIAVAFAMFSAIPCPQPTWNEKNMRFMMVAFPLVGVVCGALCGGWFVLMQFLAAPTLLPRGRVLPDSRTGNGGHPSGRVCRYLRREGELCPPGKKAGNPERSPVRRLCRHSSVRLVCGGFYVVCLHSVGTACVVVPGPRICAGAVLIGQ